MEAHGTIGGALTFQSSTKRKFVREKPELPYSLTLGQQYQRWLYEDYAYLWKQQTVTTQSEYRSAGVRFHLTGFQYWMKYHLTNLPDIAGMWHLDEKAGAVAVDFSKNAYHGTVIGASPAAGVIDGSLLSDGLNDRVDFGICPAILSADEGTCELFVNIVSLKVDGRFFEIGTGITNRIAMMLSANQIIAYNDILNANRWIPSAIFPTLGDWYHILFTFSSSGINLFIQGDLKASDAVSAKFSDLLPTSPMRLSCASWALQQWGNQYSDHFIIYNRILDQAEITRHAERRYPS